MLWASGAFSNNDCIKQKQPRDRKTLFETLSLPVTKILSPIARQAPTEIKFAHSKLYRHGVSFEKQRFLTIVLSAPNAPPPLKNANFVLFLLSSRRL